MLEKSSKMSTREAIAVLAGPYNGNRNRWLANATKAVKGVTFRTMRSLWNNEIEDPNHLAALAVKNRAEVIKAKREAAELAVQFQAIAGGMLAQDEDFYRPQIDRLERLVRIIGGLDSA